MSEVQAETEVAAQAETPKADAGFDPKETKYFGPAALQDGGTYISKIMAHDKASNLPLFFNFDPENVDIAEGFGFLVQPLQKRDPKKEELTLVGHVIGAIPDFTAIAASEKGLHYLRQIVQDAIGRRLKTAVVAAIKANEKPQLPTTMEGFIESLRKVSPLYTYNQLQDSVRKSLAKKEVHVSKEMLQGVLMSSSFASQVFPNTKQAQWEIVLDRMIELAKGKNLDPEILVKWKADRATAAFARDTEIDLGDIEF